MSIFYYTLFPNAVKSSKYKETNQTMSSQTKERERDPAAQRNVLPKVMVVQEARWRVTPDGRIRRTSGGATLGALVRPLNPVLSRLHPRTIENPNALFSWVNAKELFNATISYPGSNHSRDSNRFRCRINFILENESAILNVAIRILLRTIYEV